MTICWAGLGEPQGSRPAKRRPVLVIQAGPVNARRLGTTRDRGEFSDIDGVWLTLLVGFRPR